MMRLPHTLLVPVRLPHSGPMGGPASAPQNQDLRRTGPLLEEDLEERQDVKHEHSLRSASRHTSAASNGDIHHLPSAVTLRTNSAADPRRGAVAHATTASMIIS